jgi:hypothetical protein
VSVEYSMKISVAVRLKEASRVSQRAPRSEWVVLTEALRAEIDEKVIRVDEFLNGLLVEQKPPERS